jgi:hypothetical protein
MLNRHYNREIQDFTQFICYILEEITVAIKTTININTTILQRIKNVSMRTGKPQGKIILMLLKRAMLGNQIDIKLNVAVKYQIRDPLKQWHIFHIEYQEDVYEFCQDMRKFFKLSVSMILAIAVEHYLDEILDDYKRNKLFRISDNYPYSGYIFNKEHLDGAILWKFTWGIPKKIKQVITEATVYFS